MSALAADQRFRDVLLLGRAANAVRFAIAAGTELGDRDDAVGFRQRLASYFFVSAILEEAFILSERLGRSLKGAPSWSQLSDLRKAPATKSLRAEVLDRTRNQAVFHFDDAVIEQGLFLLGDADCVFAEGASSSLLGVHYDLADRAALAFALEGFADAIEPETVADLIRASLRLGSAFLQAADAVIGDVLGDLGLELSSADRTA